MAVGNQKITAAELAKVQKRSKFGVRHDEQGKADRTYKGILYHSKRECQYAQELDMLQRAGKIAGWQRQKAYQLAIDGHKICDYVCDFLVLENGRYRVIDVKGHMTAEARLKLKLMKAIYGIEVEVVK